MSPDALLPSLARAATFGCIIFIAGTAAWYWLILARTGPQSPLTLKATARRGTISALLLIPALIAGFIAQVLSFREPAEPVGDVVRLVLSIPWGRVWLLQLILALLLTVFFAMAKTRAVAWVPVAFAAIALAFTPAFAGHAAAVEEWGRLARMADGLHVLAAGVWLGSLANLALAVRQEPDGGILLARLARFSPLALVSAAVIAATGVTSAWIHLTRLSDLWGSPYGRLLSVKVLVFLGVLAAGAYNWRRATPRLRESADPRAMRKTIAAELAFAAVLILVTAWFVATSPPESMS